MANIHSWQAYDITVQRIMDWTATINDSVGLTDAMKKDQVKLLDDSIGMTDEATPVEG